jgi:P-type E1-E2 ATPase
VARAEELGLSLPAPSRFGSIAGHGVEATVEGRDVLIGNARLMSERGVSLGALEEQSEELSAGGKTPVYVALDGRAAGIIAVADTVKPEAAHAVGEMEALGLKVWMLTGDNRATAQAIARTLGIRNVLAEVLPADKAAKVRELQEAGERWPAP